MRNNISETFKCNIIFKFFQKSVHFISVFLCTRTLNSKTKDVFVSEIDNDACCVLVLRRNNRKHQPKSPLEYELWSIGMANAFRTMLVVF